ncbi:hypothetical protein Ancab_016534 [Ancistrocladus abbreviatus]
MAVVVDRRGRRAGQLQTASVKFPVKVLRDAAIFWARTWLKMKKLATNTSGESNKEEMVHNQDGFPTGLDPRNF